MAEGRRTGLIFGVAATVGGLLQWIATWSGFALPGDGIGVEHELHWLSHLLTVPAALALLIALYGIALLERETLRWPGRAAVLVAAAGLVMEALGGSLVGWAGGVQDVRSGGLYDVGHDIQSAGFFNLPGLVLLGLVIGLRGRYLPRASGWIPILSVPVAAAAGATIGALGADGGTAAAIFFGSIGLQYLVWGVSALGREAARGQHATRTATTPRA
jgi:hypothetical protein